jgi:hypothetical protein
MRWLLLWLREVMRTRASLAIEVVCLRQQLAVLARGRKCPPLRDQDRRFWIVTMRWFGRWREYLVMVRPEPVLR